MEGASELAGKTSCSASSASLLLWQHSVQSLPFMYASMPCVCLGPKLQCLLFHTHDIVVIKGPSWLLLGGQDSLLQMG